MSKRQISWFVKFISAFIISLVISGFKSEKTKIHNERIWFFSAGEVLEFKANDNYEIYDRSVYFNKGYTLTIVDSGEINKLGFKKIYPLPNVYKNDSCGKSKVGIPVGKRQYIVCEIEPKICGSMIFKKPDGKIFTDILFMEEGAEKQNGLVKIKDKDVYFIIPGYN